MTTTNQQHNLTGGVTLRRYFPVGANVDNYCGTVGYYQQFSDQFMFNALEYYNPKDSNGNIIGPNKFLKRVFWHIYAPGTPMPSNGGLNAEAWCVSPNAASEIHIHLRYYPPSAWGGYKMVGALSHEMGHAFHYWAGLYTGKTVLAPFEAFWEKWVSTNDTTYNSSNAPWKKVDGGVEGPWEQFANAYRYIFGALSTRGVSGPGTEDPVLAGFDDPASHPEWRKAFMLLPETLHFVEKFGCQPGTLHWMGGVGGWWEFRRADGVLVAQTGEYQWHQSINNAWQAYWPSYNWS